MRPILLARERDSPNWTTQSPSSAQIGEENARRIRTAGGEAYNLSAEAVQAFFAVVPEARDLVRTSILSHETLFTATRKHMRASAAVFMLIGLLFAVVIGHATSFVHFYGFSGYFYPVLLAEASGFICALVSAWLLYRASRGFGELVERAHSRSPFLRSLRTKD